ncbi:carboxypeptidase regulatory-like domain-containing protein [Streptomyces sp. ISL-90]|nr:carboxypeptidase regulatory-like domain-containing protein [Streptomyces sp. ISL-90]
MSRKMGYVDDTGKYIDRRGAGLEYGRPARRRMGRRRGMAVVAALALVASSQSLALTPAMAAESPSISGTVTLGTASTPAGDREVVVTARLYSDFNGSWTELKTSTDAAGRYTFESLPRGWYELGFDYVGEEGFATMWWPSHPVPSPNVTRFQLGEEALLRDITLPPGASLGGTVRNTDGVPLEAVRVTASAFDPAGGDDPVTVGTLLTAADGIYAFDGLPSAEYSLDFWTAADYESATLTGDLDLAVGEERTGVDVIMYRHTSLSGNILCPRCGDPEVTPLLSVELERDAGTGSEPVWEGAGTTPVSPTASIDRGYYTLTGLEPGSYRIRVVGDESWTPQPNASEAVAIEDGDDALLDHSIEFPKLDRDFSGDDDPDVIIRTRGGGLNLYAGDGASGWSGVSSIGSGWATMNHVFTAGDFSGDGNADVMARDRAGRLYLYRGDGSGGWLGWGVVGTGWGVMTSIFSPGDFSGDGNVDLLARDGAGDLWLYPGDGRGGLGAASKVGVGWNIFDEVFAVGDFGGYGRANVMGRDSAGQLFVYPSSGSGGWAPSSRVGTGWGAFDAVFGSGDFTGDGNDDVMGRDTAGRLWLYPGDGFSGWKPQSVVGTGWSSLLFVS